MNIKESIETELWGIDDMRWLTRETPERIFAFHNASLKRIEAAVNEHIKELEAQVPKIAQTYVDDFNCKRCSHCDTIVNISNANYCDECGAKLNWEN